MFFGFPQISCIFAAFVVPVFLLLDCSSLSVASFSSSRRDLEVVVPKFDESSDGVC